MLLSINFNVVGLSLILNSNVTTEFQTKLRERKKSLKAAAKVFQQWS
jgi:hypothetical protein